MKNIAFICDSNLISASSLIPNIADRGKMVIELIRSYNLLSKMTVIPSRLASIEEIQSFHSESYVNYLIAQKLDINESSKSICQCCAQNDNLFPLSCPQCYTQEIEAEIDEVCDSTLDNEFGLLDDCPLFAKMENFIRIIGGSTIVAAEALNSRKYKFSINWSGGWHHAQRDQASGFCYVNDIVIGIQVLLKTFKKVLYIDLDAHHGDGVENAFSYTNKVLTFSIHNFEPGYFPGTGNLSDIGFGRGKNYAVNVPLKSGITDGPYFNIFNSVLDSILPKFSPEAIVLQCGADSLAGDRLGTFNLTEKSFGESLKKIIGLELPTMILGGGGYNLVNTAKCWTYLTGIICNEDLSEDIPENFYFEKYGPDFELKITKGLRMDENSPEYLSSILKTIKGNLANIRATFKEEMQPV